MLLPCPSFPWFFGFIKENLKITKDFLSLPNPQNPWKRQRKHQNCQGNSSSRIYQGNQKNQGKEGLGVFTNKGKRFSLRKPQNLRDCKGGVKNRNKRGCKRLFAFVCVCSRLFTFVHVCLLFRLCVCLRLSAFLCVCSRLRAFAYAPLCCTPLCVTLKNPWKRKENAQNKQSEKGKRARKSKKQGLEGQGREKVSKLGGFPLFRERSRLCRRPFRDCSSWARLIGRERGKGQIGKIPGQSPDKSGKSRKNRESPKKKRTKKEGQVQIENPPPLKTPPFSGP